MASIVAIITGLVIAGRPEGGKSQFSKGQPAQSKLKIIQEW